MAKTTEQATAITNQFPLKPVPQQYPAFMPGFQQRIADQMNAGFGGGADQYMADMNKVYSPVNFQQYQYPLDALLGNGGTGTPGATPISGLTWDIYKQQYKKGDGSVYPAGMKQNAFNTWLAQQNGATPAPAAPMPSQQQMPNSPLSGVMGAYTPPTQQQPRPYYTTMDGRDAYRNTGQIGGLF